MRATSLARVRWMWVLPSTMLVCTTFLIFLAAKQEEQFFQSSDTPWAFQPPARLVAQLLNGPGFLLTFLVPGVTIRGHYIYDFGRLAGVVLFWTWVGWELDRRTRDTRKYIITIPWLRGWIYATLFGLSVLMLVGTVLDLHSSGLLFSHLLWDEISVWGLWISVLAKYAGILWFIAGAIYFLRQLMLCLSVK
jgi:hypothetical protein